MCWPWASDLPEGLTRNPWLQPGHAAGVSAECTNWHGRGSPQGKLPPWTGETDLEAQVEAGLKSGSGNSAASLGTTQSGCLLLRGKLLLRAAEQLRALGGVHANSLHPKKVLMLPTRPQGDHMVAQRLLLRPLGYPLRCTRMPPCPCLRQKLKLQRLALAY